MISSQKSCIKVALPSSQNETTNNTTCDQPDLNGILYLQGKGSPLKPVLGEIILIK